MSKAFRKVWHQGLPYISGKLWNTLKTFLDNTTQKVILNDRYSSWFKVKTGVSQGLFLEPLLFLIYINNLSKNLVLNSELFADDTSLFSADKDFDSSNINLENDSKKNRGTSIPMENEFPSWSF